MRSWVECEKSESWDSDHHRAPLKLIQIPWGLGKNDGECEDLDVNSVTAIYQPSLLIWLHSPAWQCGEAGSILPVVSASASTASALLARFFLSSAPKIRPRIMCSMMAMVLIAANGTDAEVCGLYSLACLTPTFWLWWIRTSWTVQKLHVSRWLCDPGMPHDPFSLHYGCGMKRGVISVGQAVKRLIPASVVTRYHRNK